MHQYLCEHPELHLLPKELHYWGSDLEYMYPRMPEATYQAYLSSAPADKMIGEVAVWYLHSEKAAEELHLFTPDAKIIMMLRDPVSACHSLHSQMHYTGNEPLEDFEDALEAEMTRSEGKNLPDHYYCPQQGLLYQKVYQYQQQVTRYQRLFGANQIHIIFYEDFKVDTAAAYKKCLEFLGVSTDHVPNLEVVNANQVTRNRALQRLILKPGAATKSVVKGMIPSKRIRERLKARVWEANSKQAQRAELSEAIKQQLEQAFAAEIKYLENLKSS